MFNIHRKLTRSLLVRNVFLVSWVFVTLFVTVHPAAGVEDPHRRTILVLHTLKATQPWVQLFNRYLVEELTKNGLSECRLEIESLDLLDYNNGPHKEILKSLLNSKYTKQPPSILIVTFDVAIHFINDYNLFQGVPKILILPAGIGLPDIPDSVVIPFAYDFKGKIEHCLELLPETKDIYVVSGNATVDKRTMATFQDEVKDLKDRVAFHYLTEVTVDGILKKAGSLPPDSVVYYLSYSLDSRGRTVVARDFCQWLGEKSNRPVFTYYDLFALNTGVLGGKVTATRAFVATAAGIIGRVYHGEAMASQKAGRHHFDYIYDWNELVRWGIDEDKLPPGSIVQNRTYTFYELYHKEIWVGGGVVVTELALILFLLASAKKRRMAEKESLSAKDRLEKILETLPVGIWFTDSNGKIIYGNPAALNIWQGARYVEPEAYHEYKAWWRETGKRIAAGEWAVARAIRDREISKEEEIEIECFDGTRKVILNWALPIFDGNGQVQGAVAVNQDISERIRMDEALNVQKRILDRSQEIAHLGSWHLDIKNNILTWSDEEYRIFGQTPEEFGATFESFLAAVHPDDREMVDSTYRNAIQNKIPYECVHRVVLKNGEVRVVLEKSEDIVDENGETAHSFGFTQDITEQKRAEEEREKMIENLQKSVDEIQTLRGILPICSFCKNIRNDNGYYEKIEAYFHKHSGVDFSHTICPRCLRENFPDEYDEVMKGKDGYPEA